MTSLADSKMPNDSSSEWLVYMLQCADATLYTGITNDLSARLAAHNAGRGAKYTRSRLPVTLVHKETAVDRSAALRREYEIKKLSAGEKRALIGA